MSKEHDVKRLSFLGKASFIATGIWHMIKMPEFVKNPENTQRRNSYVVGDTCVLACGPMYRFVYAHKWWSISIRSLYIIQMFVLISTLKLQLKVEL